MSKKMALIHRIGRYLLYMSGGYVQLPEAKWHNLHMLRALQCNELSLSDVDVYKLDP